MSNDHRIDPVCGMEVAAHQNKTVYLRSHYAFCSQHCLDRFIAHSHPYVGMSGHKAPKQEGKEVLKCRSLRLASPLSTGQALLLGGALEAMMSVKKVSAGDDRVELTYDPLQVTAEKIKAKIAEIGIRLGEGWLERLRLAFGHYQEECEVGNLEVQERHVHRSGH